MEANSPEHERQTTHDEVQNDDIKILHWYSIDPHMFPSKIVTFFDLVKEGSVYEYVILFLVSIGLNPAQAGLTGGMLLTGGMIGGPFWGFIADKKLWHGPITKILCIMMVLTSCLIPLVAAFFGDHDKNSCPIKSYNSSTNITGNARIGNNDNNKLFYMLLLTAATSTFFGGPSRVFINVGILRAIGSSPRKNSIGRQWVLAPAGFAFGGFLSGIAIDHFPHSRISCYAGIFFIYMISAIFLALGFHFLFKNKRADNVNRNQVENINPIILRQLRCFDTWFFFAVILFNGIVFSLVFSFSFLFLRELQASHSLLGISMLVQGIFTTIFYFLSQIIIDFVGGPIRGIALSYFGWFIRCLCLSYIKNPFEILGINALNGITSSIFICAYMECIKRKYPTAIHTVMFGMCVSLYNYGGAVIANVAGGVLYKKFGGRKLFIFCSITCAIWTIITLIYDLVDRFRNQNNRINTGLPRDDNVDHNCHVTVSDS